MASAQQNNAGMGKDIMDFHARSELGEKFSKQIFNDLEMWGFNVALNGTEHTNPYFVGGLKSSEDKTSLMIRFQPDGVASIGNIPRSVYVEAKRSKFIEKNAYDSYMDLHKIGGIVFVVFGIYDKDNKSLEIKFIDIQKLKFIPALTNSKWPVIDGWISPRSHNNWHLEKQTFTGSGTPFLQIDQICLIQWSQFKKYAIECMKCDNLEPQ